MPPKTPGPTSPSESQERRCFVISPIGGENTETRKRSDLVLSHIILPAARAAGYTDENVKRSDQIPQPGIITSQVVQHLVDDELVIADLTDHNANVFYELAIRHATRKAVVLLIRTGQTIPFDVAPNRVIQYDLTDWNSPVRCADELTKQIEAVLKDPLSADNPISAGMTFKALKESSDPIEQIVAEIVPRLQALEVSTQAIQAGLRARTIDWLAVSADWPKSPIYVGDPGWSVSVDTADLAKKLGAINLGIADLAKNPVISVDAYIGKKE